MIQKTNIQTNQTRSYVNLFDQNSKLKYDLGDSNLDFVISFSTPLEEGDTIFNFLKVQATWYDNTNERNQTLFSNNTNFRRYLDFVECNGTVFPDLFSDDQEYTLQHFYPHTFL